MTLRGRAPRYAVLSPYAATFVATKIPERDWAAAADACRRFGRPDWAEEIEAAFRQVRTAHQERDEHEGEVSGSDVRTSEPLIGGLGASFGEMTTKEAAQMLGESSEMTARRLRSGQLSGRRVSVRAWAVERDSVLALIEARRSA